jgi:thiamine kinase-like enzyme
LNFILTQDFDQVLTKFGLPHCPIIKALGKGLINSTWLVETLEGDSYILQRVNQHVFRNPEIIGKNIRTVFQYLKENHPDYLFPSLISSQTGKDYVRDNSGGYYRLFHHIKNSHTVEVVDSPDLAFGAAHAFGKLTRLLAPLDLDQIKITLNNFHNLSFRYEEFFWAFNRASDERKALAKSAIQFLGENRSISLEYELIKKDPGFKQRITHHDTKIGNVLLDTNHQVISVIDLDTLMPGYFISDLGDMIRTYLSPVSEEEQDFSLIGIRQDYLEAVLDGYLSGMDTELSSVEKKYLLYAGKFMIYMQAMRFTTDFLNQDIYYETHYPLHNLNRALNQITLFKNLIAHKDFFNSHHPGQR